jgi:serine/threonine protein kinase
VALKIGLSGSDQGMSLRVLQSELEAHAGLQRTPLECKRVVNLIASLHGPTKDGQLRGLVLEYCEGGSLADKIDDNVDFGKNLATRLACVRQMREGVAYMHSRGLVHMDLKPGNLLLRTPNHSHEDLDLAVGDFGMTKCVGYPLRHAVGTAGYMAPEVVRACEKQAKVQPHMDVWSIGVIMLETLGCLECSTISRSEVRAALDSGTLLQQLGLDEAECEDCFRELILSCLHLEPRERATIEQLLAAVMALQEAVLQPQQCSADLVGIVRAVLRPPVQAQQGKSPVPLARLWLRAVAMSAASSLRAE